MRHNFVKHIIFRVFGWILLLQILNISIDPPTLRNFKAFTLQQENLSLNEIESVYELIAEGVFENDVPEVPGDNDADDRDSQLQAFDLYCSNVAPGEPLSFNYFMEHFSYYSNRLFFGFLEPTSPPPKHV